MKILGIAGSLRKRSYNRSLIRAAQELAPEGVEFVIHDLKPIPLYNGDLEVGAGPGPVVAFKQAISGAHGVLIATPEYNFGIPGVLKNALDWASRPMGHSALADKPVAIVGASPGAVGTARAQGQLKQVLVACQMLLLPRGEFLAGGATQKFDEQGQLTDEGTRDRLTTLLTEFVTWIDRVSQ